MGDLEKIASKTRIVIRLREEIPISQLTPAFFRFKEHYDLFLKDRAKGRESIYVFILADGKSGEVRVLGVSEKPNGDQTREMYDGMGQGTIPFVLDRLAQVRSFLPDYAPKKDDLYAVARTPTSGVIVADSRPSQV